MRYSLALLVKQNAAQLNYAFRHASVDAGKSQTSYPEANEWQEAGNKYAAKMSISKYVEMVTSLRHKDDVIYSSVDEIRAENSRVLFVEHKVAVKDNPLWYERNSIIQVAAYAAFQQNSYAFQTAKFQVASGGESHSLRLNPSVARYYILNLGGRFIELVDADFSKFRRFYMTKLRASKDYSKARKFDNTFKHKEWEYFKDSICVQ